MSYLLNDLLRNENNNTALTYLIYFAIYFLTKIPLFRL